MLISWSIIVDLSISHYSSFILLQVCWSSLIRCIFRAVMSSCWMSLLFIMKLTIHVLGINPTWSQCMILLLYVEFSLLIFVENFCISVHQGYWLLIIFYCGVLTAFSISILLVPYNEFGGIPFSSNFWKNLIGLVLILLWIFGRVHQLSCLMLGFVCWRFLITDYFLLSYLPVCSNFSVS